MKIIRKKDGKEYSVRENRARFFYPDEWMKFYDGLENGRQKFTFNFLLNTGARIMEAQNVKVEDCDLQNNRINLRITKSKVKMKTQDGKKIHVDSIRRPRIIPISSKFARELKKIISQTKLKGGDTFELLETSRANRVLKSTLEKVGIKDYNQFSNHNIRKTLESWLLALDVDSLKIIKHFGHTLKVAAEHYVNPDIFNREEKTKMRRILGDLYERGGT